MRRGLVLVGVLLLACAGRSAAIVSVAVVDGTATLAEVAPTPGAAAVRFSTTDGLRFSNDGATEAELIVFTAAHEFRHDRDGSTATSSVTHQGVTTQLADNLFVAQSASGAFLPLRLVTAADLTGQAGWTKHAGCGTVDHQGQLTIPWHSNAGAAQTALVRYYQVCDGATEAYVDSDKTLTDADFAYVQTVQQVLGAEADHEVVIEGTDYAFASAASAAAVTFSQARYVGSSIGGATTLDLFFLYRFPDGFPAGVTTTTITATATDIVST